jgi:hypothetical protein
MTSASLSLIGTPERYAVSLYPESFVSERFIRASILSPEARKRSGFEEPVPQDVMFFSRL